MLTRYIKFLSNTFKSTQLPKNGAKLSFNKFTKIQQ